MTCDNAILLMGSHIDGEITAEEEALLQAHLDRCEDCRRLLSAYESIHNNTASLAVPAPEGLKQGVMYRISQETGKRKKSRRLLGPGTAVGAVAAVLVLLVGTGVIRLPGRPGSDTKQSVGKTATASVNDWIPLDPESSDRLQGLEESLIMVPGGLRHSEAGEPKENYGGILNGDRMEDSDSKGEFPGGEELLAPTASLKLTVEDCVQLSVDSDTPVLVYTDFGAQSLLELLRREEPLLYAAVEDLEPTQTDGAVVIPTTYRNIMAIHEWILENLPQSESLDAAAAEAGEALLRRVEELDSDGKSLQTIITWIPRQKAVAWPESWPEDWASRLCSAENWALIYPREEYVPQAEGTAYLVFLPLAED